MKSKKSFYIGWQNEMPGQQKKFLKRIIIPLFLLMPILAFVIVKGQRPFNNHIFELGKVKEYSGIYHPTPVPILEMDEDAMPPGISNYVLLVGFGKFGAEGIISTLEKNNGSLRNQKIVLKGSLIYGDGKAVLELTKKKKSLVRIIDMNAGNESVMTTPVPFDLEGEILDPKCYFGVMKPGEGKIHKSCAVRCISGGIPPVFRDKSANGNRNYSILLGPDGQKINKEILEKIGEQVNIKGTRFYRNGWDVIYVDPKEIERI